MEIRVTMFRFVILLGLILLTACATPMQADRPAHANTAIVTSIVNGRKSVPAERIYGLRVPSGRVHFVTQSLKNPPRIGDWVEIEVSEVGTVSIRER